MDTELSCMQDLKRGWTNKAQEFLPWLAVPARSVSRPPPLPELKESFRILIVVSISRSSLSTTFLLASIRGAMIQLLDAVSRDLWTLNMPR